MVHGHQAIFFFAVLEHGEIDHPKQRKLVLVAQTEALAHEQTELAKLFARLVGIVAAENKDEIAGIGTHGLFEVLQNLRRVELVDRTFHTAVFTHTGVDESFRTNLL